MLAKGPALKSLAESGAIPSGPGPVGTAPCLLPGFKSLNGVLKLGKT